MEADLHQRIIVVAFEPIVGSTACLFIITIQNARFPTLSIWCILRFYATSYPQEIQIYSTPSIASFSRFFHISVMLNMRFFCTRKSDSFPRSAASSVLKSWQNPTSWFYQVVLRGSCSHLKSLLLFVGSLHTRTRQHFTVPCPVAG
jgi:hypothetical protein